MRVRRATTRAAIAAIAVCAMAALACRRESSSAPTGARAAPPPEAVTPAAPAAAGALPSSAGPAYLIVERPSGRVLASARPEEIERPVWPGSIAKIPLLEAALERGVVDARTELVCRRDLVVDGHRLTCSHPDLGRPLTAAEALAHSCNSFFVTVASRVPREALNAARVALGWPPIGPTDPYVPAALGLAGPRVAPRLLADALVRAVAEPPAGLDAVGREILVRGLGGAATYGTADALADLPGETYAKTGTAPMAGGGFMGLVVAFRPTPTFWGPREAGLSIVVLAPGAAGRDAALVARGELGDVPGAGVGAEVGGTLGESRRGERAEPSGRPPFAGLPATVRVGETSGRRYRSRVVPLEEYVARAVAGEAAPATPPGALEALAITARTYAVANLGRHAGDGFDLCDLTHCQALKPATPASRAAAAATAGRILTYAGRPARVFYSASCGGWSASPAEIWPDASAAEYPYLVSRAEPECRESSRWTAEISARDLTRALRAAGLRGSVLRDVRVAGHTGSGRVSRVRVEGFEPAELTAEEFRLAVGRTLGWNLVKSHLFDVRRVSTGYRFAGFGAGHGVGLCLTGAARLGRGGRGAAAILQTYFPGTVVSSPAAAPAPGRPPAVRLVLPAAEERERRAILTLVERGLADLQARTGAAAPSRLTIRVHPTVESFRRATGRPWWVAGATRGEQIDLLPVDVLLARGILRSTLTHELAHVLVDPVVGARRIWVREGLAAVFAGESYGGPLSGAACPSDEEFDRQQDGAVTFDLYARAVACVRRELDAGRPWRLIGAARD